jgi:hypothetical protein
MLWLFTIFYCHFKRTILYVNSACIKSFSSEYGYHEPAKFVKCSQSKLLLLLNHELQLILSVISTLSQQE